MNYCKLNKYDVANGPGVRVSLFVSGCRNYCKGCFNKAAWDFNYGKLFNGNTMDEIIETLSLDYISGLTILGGEPFEPENQNQVYNIVKYVRLRFPNKTIWIYSGYTIEQILREKNIKDTTYWILSNCDVLVDGKFDESLYDISLRFRGSSNQRIIDLKNTLHNYNKYPDSFTVETIDIDNN